MVHLSCASRGTGRRGSVPAGEKFDILRNVHDTSRAAQGAFVAAAGGNVPLAYRTWLKSYINDKIQPSRFRRPGAPRAGGVDQTGALAAFAGPDIAVTMLGGEKKLLLEIQQRLSDLGYLDPPPDGNFGPTTRWALAEFYRDNGLSPEESFTLEAARTLLAPKRFLPAIRATGGWFDRVVDYMAKQGYFICRHPECKNIVYLEGVDPNGASNNDEHNVFNDLRIVFWIDATGAPVMKIWEATTEPGDVSTKTPPAGEAREKGVARIAFGQYKAWTVGPHPNNPPPGKHSHEALVQVADVTVYRDLNKDFERPGDKPYTGTFGINQHWGYDQPRENVGGASAGCLVGRSIAGHKEFMAMVKEDPRYKANNGYRFVTAILPGDKVLAG